MYGLNACLTLKKIIVKLNTMKKKIIAVCLSVEIYIFIANYLLVHSMALFRPTGHRIALSSIEDQPSSFIAR